MKRALYRTKLGKMIVGDSIELYSSHLKKHYKNKVNLIITSPPFPLNSKKMYGNLNGETYLKWFTDLVTTEKLLFGFTEMRVRDDGVVPAWQNAKRFEIDKRFLLIGNMVASFILFSIQIGPTA
jgi:hypothetical protein